MSPVLPLKDVEASSETLIQGVPVNEVPMQGYPLPPNATTVVIAQDESAAKCSNKMMVASASLCVVSLLSVIAAQYYLYLYVNYDDDVESSKSDEAANVLFSIASVAAVVAAILGAIYIRDLPEESRKICKIGIAVVGVIFFVAAAVLFAIWVAPRDRDAAPSDGDDDHNFHGLTILVGCVLQIAVLVVVIIFLCVAFCVASCCKPAQVTIEHRVQHQ
eukprot:TRINITY_DN31_c1_g1_i11.p1 TRINITY_DN31_c1_g1~~TRINITY_DN31_c1_g1_i11.p1  ORF type:complete len:242 (+),score=49.58 TRINITY_DN31_c1_g1_i11:74-727(+)